MKTIFSFSLVALFATAALAQEPVSSQQQQVPEVKGAVVAPKTGTTSAAPGLASDQAVYIPKVATTKATAPKDAKASAKATKATKASTKGAPVSSEPVQAVPMPKGK